ncbi:MAG: hypothetical protein ACRCUY_08325 [Thermoguttaceae bacterium]
MNAAGVRGHGEYETLCEPCASVREKNSYCSVKAGRERSVLTVCAM